MTSKTARKRRKRRKGKLPARITLPGGETVPQAQPREKPTDPRKTVATARQRHSGITDPQEAMQPLCGSDMGLCIRALSIGDARAELANTWAAISASHRNFRLLVIGQTGGPQGAAIAMVPDQMETDQSLRIDLRTHDERVAAAKASWAAWEGKINAMPVPTMRWALRGALDGFLGEATLWRDQAPTSTGALAVMALRATIDKTAKP